MSSKNINITYVEKRMAFALLGKVERTKWVKFHQIPSFKDKMKQEGMRQKRESNRC